MRIRDWFFGWYTDMSMHEKRSMWFVVCAFAYMIGILALLVSYTSVFCVLVLAVTPPMLLMANHRFRTWLLGDN